MIGRGRTRLFLGDLSGGTKLHLRPVADVATGAFSVVGGSNARGGLIRRRNRLFLGNPPALYPVLADALDTTYAEAILPSVFVVKLPGVTDPLVSGGHILRFRGNRGVITAASFKLSLYSGDPNAGGTLIAETTRSLSVGVADYSLTLTAPQANSISASDYNGNLYLRGEAL